MCSTRGRKYLSNYRVRFSKQLEVEAKAEPTKKRTIEPSKKPTIEPTKAPCLVNQYVPGNTCVACPAGTMQEIMLTGETQLVM